MSEKETRDSEKRSKSYGSLQYYDSPDEEPSVSPIDFSMSLVDLAMLSLLASVPVTGCVLRKLLLSEFGLRTSYGTLYPRLKSLEKSRIIKSSDSVGALASRKSGINYELTAYGRKVLDLNLRRSKELLKRVQLSRSVLDSVNRV